MTSSVQSNVLWMSSDASETNNMVSTSALVCVILEMRGDGAVPAHLAESQSDTLKTYLMERRRSLLTELSCIEKILGIQRSK